MSADCDGPADVVIVGSGPVGTAIARELADSGAGLRIVVLEAGRALSDPAAGQRTGAGGQLGQHAVARLDVGDVLDVTAGRVAEGPPRLEDDDPEADLQVGELAGDRSPDRAGAHDQDVTVRGHRATAASASSRRLSMSCWARIWSKAL